MIEGDDYASKQLNSLKDVPARLLTWWYKSVVDKSPYDSMPVRIWQWLTHNVIKHEMLKSLPHPPPPSNPPTPPRPRHPLSRSPSRPPAVSRAWHLHARRSLTLLVPQFDLACIRPPSAHGTLKQTRTQPCNTAPAAAAPPSRPGCTGRAGSARTVRPCARELTRAAVGRFAGSAASLLSGVDGHWQVLCGGDGLVEAAHVDLAQPQVRPPHEPRQGRQGLPTPPLPFAVEGVGV